MSLDLKSKLLSLPSHNSVLIETVQTISDNLRTIIVEHGVKFIGLFGSITWLTDKTLSKRSEVLEKRELKALPC